MSGRRKTPRPKTKLWHDRLLADLNNYVGRSLDLTAHSDRTRPLKHLLVKKPIGSFASGHEPGYFGAPWPLALAAATPMSTTVLIKVM